MKSKNFWITVIVIFLVCLAYEFLVHGYILNNQYYKNLTPSLFLSMNGAERQLGWLFRSAIFIAEFIASFFFVLIYSRGVEGKGWLGEGFRYGFLIWGVAVLAPTVGMYSFSKYPGKLLLWWIVYGLIEMVILGWVCAALYKKPAQ
ncbi:MAG: DUF1761 domain-containing protein [Acidobacteriia bacterium]|nr:DUF1761 domain-containing protein [Terriglobia bacterium]